MEMHIDTDMEHMTIDPKILIAAIKQLEHRNTMLERELCLPSTKDKEQIQQEINKNNSLILDYTFRLNQTE